MSGAVFLSYASQDAEEAKKICDALRAAGVEVWFDQSELRGGDSWDQKIRRQIKECVLFMPVVSANTQARREGYFRLEWKLADDRTHLMAKGTPFLVPVCIDETKDWDALVPDSFMNVQWTRLAGGETTEKFCGRVVHLLEGGSIPPMPTRPPMPMAPRAEPAATAPASVPEKKMPVWPLALGACLVVAVGIFFALRPGPPAPASVPVEKKSSVPAPATAAWPRDPELKRAMDLVNGTEGNLEDFTLAAEIVQRVLTTRPTDPETVTVMARVEVSFLFRGFDRSDERRATARRYAERAVQLAPDEPEALAALGVFFIQRAADLPRARELLDRAIALKPTEPFFYRHRDNALFADPKVPVADALASAERTAARFPDDALSHYELARHDRDAGRIAEMERELDRTIAITPIANAIVWKARVALWVRGDAEEMRALIERVPSRERSLERVVFSRWSYAMATGQIEDGLNALENLTSSWIEDFDYVGPKALLKAQLLELQGKRELARLQYEIALAEVRAQQARRAGDPAPQRVVVFILHGLGKDDEARAANRTALETARRPYGYGTLSDWMFTPIPGCLLIGDRDTALQLLREAVTPTAVNSRINMLVDAGGVGAPEENAAAARAALRLRFKFDPRMAPFRGDPEIVALLAEPKKETPAAPLTEAAKLTARAVTLYSKFSYTRDDLATAEELARKATELEPDSAAAWGARAGVHATYFSRNWDLSEKRRLDLQTAASRALGLNPDEPEALLALGRLLTAQGRSVWPQAEAALKRAVAARPDDNRVGRALGFFYGVTGRTEQERVILQTILKRDARDPLVHYDLAMSYANYGTNAATAGNVTAAIQELDAGIAAQPLGSLLILKAALAAGWRGDLPTMRAQLDQLEKLPLSERTEDRAVFITMWGGLLERKPALVAAAGALTAKSYFDDSVVPRRPKDWALALAHRIEGKDNLARLDWQKAESVLRQRLRDDANNQLYGVELAATLAWLGRIEEAAREVAPIEAAWREELTAPRARLLATYYAAAGDADKGVPYLQRAVNGSAFMTRQALRLDPYWDKLRGSPQFEALFAEPAPKK